MCILANDSWWSMRKRLQGQPDLMQGTWLWCDCSDLNLAKRRWGTVKQWENPFYKKKWALLPTHDTQGIKNLWQVAHLDREELYLLSKYWWKSRVVVLGLILNPGKCLELRMDQASQTPGLLLKNPIPWDLCCSLGRQEGHNPRVPWSGILWTGTWVASQN